MSKIPTYSAHGGSHTGTSGFINHFPGGPLCDARARARVFRDFPNSVIVDGSDDWYSPPWSRPAMLVNRYGIKPLAYFHSGISGISKSGVVLTREDWETLRKRCEADTFKYKPKKTFGYGEEQTVTGMRVQARVYHYRPDGDLALSRTEKFNGKEYQVSARCLLDGSTVWSLWMRRGGVAYRMEATGEKVRINGRQCPTMRPVNERTGKPPKSGALKDALFVEKQHGLALLNTPAANRKEGWHGNCYYG